MATKKLPALERARADLAAGRPDLARDKIHGHLHALHLRGDYDADAYVLLGDVYWAMRDFARAGAACLLTDRDDENAEFAFGAFKSRYGDTPANMLAVVKPRAKSELYPEKVQERLLRWGYRYFPQGGGSLRGQTLDGEPIEVPTESVVRPIEGGCLLATILAFVMFCAYVYLTVFGRSK